MTLHIYSKSTSEAQRVKKRRGLKNDWRCGLEGSRRLFPYGKFAKEGAKHEAPAACGCFSSRRLHYEAQNMKRRQPAAVSAAVVRTMRRKT
jgi:hypothetical protein